MWANTYRQWFGHSDVDGAVAGGFEDVHGIIQAGSLQVRLVNEHESVTRQQATISVGHAPWHQGANDQHGFRGVFRVLPFGEKFPGSTQNHLAASKLLCTKFKTRANFQSWLRI